VQVGKQVAFIVAVVTALIELGGIWHELHHLRQEQVKNQYYAIPKEARAKISEKGKASLQSSSTVLIDGPVDVEVRNSSIDVEVQNTVPVEIQR
jgi:hypothetical protein